MVCVCFRRRKSPEWEKGSIELKNGNTARVTLHLLEGSREQIEAQLRQSIDAFFDFFPEI